MKGVCQAAAGEDGLRGGWRDGGTEGEVEVRSRLLEVRRQQQDTR